MLLATGIYPRFIEAISDITRLRFRLSSIIVLGTVVGAAILAILLLAGPTKDLVIHRRWIMYSLFIGLTLGGVPIVWKLARPASTAVWVGAAAGIAAMVAMLLIPPPGASSGEGAMVLLFLSGLAGASAMILPGVSGGYLLLLLGQYVPILSAVDLLKQALLGDAGFDMGLAMQAAGTLAPVFVGIAVGVLGVSNLLQWLLVHARKATLGVLLGLLLGAVIGLWPFQRSVTPVPGDVIKGSVVTEQSLAEIDPEDYLLERFAPTAGQVAGSVGLILAGFAFTLVIGRLNRSEEDDAA